MENKENQLEIKSIQIALFFKQQIIKDEYDKAQLLLDIKKELPIFDAAPTQIPSFPDIQIKGLPSLPIMILNSNDKLFSCNIASNRVDFISKNFGVFSEELFEKIKNNTSNIFNFFQKKTEINRIGFVFNCQYKNTGKAKFISDNFLKSEQFKDPKEVSLRYAQESNLDGILMNNLITLSGDRKKDFIQVQLDINTAPEIVNTLVLTSSLLSALYRYVYLKVDNSVKNFPNLEFE